MSEFVDEGVLAEFAQSDKSYAARNKAYLEMEQRRGAAYIGAHSRDIRVTLDAIDSGPAWMGSQPTIGSRLADVENRVGKLENSLLQND